MTHPALDDRDDGPMDDSVSLALVGENQAASGLPQGPILVLVVYALFRAIGLTDLAFGRGTRR